MQGETMGPGKQMGVLFESQTVLYCVSATQWPLHPAKETVLQTSNSSQALWGTPTHFLEQFVYAIAPYLDTHLLAALTPCFSLCLKRKGFKDTELLSKGFDRAKQSDSYENAYV